LVSRAALPQVRPRQGFFHLHRGRGRPGRHHDRKQDGERGQQVQPSESRHGVVSFERGRRPAPDDPDRRRRRRRASGHSSFFWASSTAFRAAAYFSLATRNASNTGSEALAIPFLFSGSFSAFKASSTSFTAPSAFASSSLAFLAAAFALA